MDVNQRLNHFTILLFHWVYSKIQLMIIGVLLAGGKGSRFKSKDTNKTAVLFNNKPLIQYGVEIYKGVTNKTFIVVGAYRDSVIKALKNPQSISFVDQRKRLGTGHAVKLVMEDIKKKNLRPSVVLVGNGDHMMFYTKDVFKDMLEDHVLEGRAVTFITTTMDNPKGMGRVIRNKKGLVQKIVEEKDATPSERRVTEINAGFYCFSYDFLKKNYRKLAKSPASGEYYITEFIGMAMEQGLPVEGHKIPFQYVGYGINTREDLQSGLSLYSSR